MTTSTHARHQSSSIYNVYRASEKCI